MEQTLREIIPSIFDKVFGKADYCALEIRPEGIHIARGDDSQTVLYHELEQVELKSGLFWRSLQIHQQNCQPLLLKGIQKLDTQMLDQLIRSEKQRFHAAQAALETHAQLIHEGAEWVRDCLQGAQWVSNAEAHELKSQVEALDEILRIAPDALTDDARLQASLHVLPKTDEDRADFRRKSNEAFVPLELGSFDDFFNTIESNPLTDAQRLAIITHEDNTRVIAGAGSGKTSVIVAKTGYLIKNRLCEPSEILLLAFNASAAKEIRDRIKDRLGIDVKATTFHALGLSIMGAVTGRKPSIAGSAGDSAQFSEDIGNILVHLYENSPAAKALRTYIQCHLLPMKSESDFESWADYCEYIDRQTIRTLRGEQVANLAELEVANFLYLNGIGYEYQKPYQFNTVAEHERQYEPNFYLTDHDIYLEHFCINREGEPDAHLDAEEHVAEILWTRQIHEEHQTALIETYSYMKRENTLSTDLEELLAAYEIPLQPLSWEVLRPSLVRDYHLAPLIKLITTFLGQFKGNQFSVKHIRERASSWNQTSLRFEAYLDLFPAILEEYERRLRDTDSIDFDDMTASATSWVQSNNYISPYTCVLVDEFQDISVGRAKLVKALVDQRPTNKLFCVGDDWQAINRFAGGDIALMRNFESHFGFTETIYLDRTFRFNDRIEEVATTFVLKNPAQIAKAIKPMRRSAQACVTIHYPDVSKAAMILKIMRQIHDEQRDASVLFLGRYRHVEDGVPWGQISQQFPALTASFKTVHSAKGQEADYVIVLDIAKGKYGFPSEMQDDPILDTVLSEPEGFEHSEERRLFYVALTRAKHAVHLISATQQPSPFLKELSEDKDNVLITGTACSTLVKCPACKTADMMLRTGEYGNYYSCTSYPHCSHKEPVCPECKLGYPEREGDRYICNNSACSFAAKACPKCKTGRLMERRGAHGVFLGCSNLSKGTCSHSQNM